MTRFGCLGGDCEDTCCQGWTVPVDEPTHRRLKVLAAKEPLAEQMLGRGIELTPRGPHFGRLRFGESGLCGMLDDAGLCGIHARLGPDALFDVCSTYPRYFNEVDGELELFGTVSCPEVARQLLFGAGALALEPVAQQEAPRKLRNQFRTDQPYYQPFVLVRSAFAQLLTLTDYTPSEKLFALLWVASKLSEVVHAGAKSVPAAELGKALTAMLAPEVVSHLVASYRTLGLDGSLALSVLTSALAESPATSDQAANWRDYTERCSRLPAAAQQRSDSCLARYAQNHLYTTPYMLHESLFAFARDLIWRVALLRYQLHQALAGFDGDAAAVDRRIIDVVYKFGRRAEHSELFARIAEQLANQQLDSFAHTVCFLRV